MNGIGKKTTLEYKSPLWKKIRLGITVFAVLVSLPALWYSFVQARKANRVRQKIAVEKREFRRKKR